MDKIESTKKIYYDVLPAYNIDTALTYSSNQVFKVGSLVKISIRKKILSLPRKDSDLTQFQSSIFTPLFVSTSLSSIDEDGFLEIWLK